VTDLAHKALEARIIDAREAYLSADEAGQPHTAALAYTLMDDLLSEYTHLPQQDDRILRHPTDVPVPPTTTT
jgi:hypothetical protein